MAKLAKRAKSKEESKAEDASVVSPTAKIPTKSTKLPQTMEELLSMTGYNLKGVKKGDIVEGKIGRVSPREITIDIGGKTEGVVIDRELETYKDALLALKPGDAVVAQVILAEKQKSGQPIEVILKEPVRGGMLADYGGLRGYIPQSQLDSATMKQTDKASGRKVSVKVVEVDRESNRLVFSQRQVAEGEGLAKQKEVLDSLTSGESVAAIITGVVPFGAFAKLKVTKDETEHEIEGLIHISEIAWEKVDDPGQYLKVGDSLKVKVVGVDKETGKLTLSLKQLLPDPWEHVLDMFEKDTTVKGTVARVSPYGIFVTLSPGIEGLIHISKLTPGAEPKVGEEISCLVEDIKGDARKISLSMALTEKPIGYR